MIHPEQKYSYDDDMGNCAMLDNILAMIPMVLSDVAEYAFPMNDDDMGNCAMLDVLTADWEGIHQPETLYKTFSISESRHIPHIREAEQGVTAYIM